MTKRKKRTHKLDAGQVKQIASGRWIDILADVGGIPREVLDGRHHPCPQCGGRDRFRFIDDSVGAVMCNQCLDKNNGDGFSALQWSLGIDFQETLAKVADFLGIKSTNGSSNIKPPPDEHLVWQNWNEGYTNLAKLWCLKKKPITIESIQAAGGRMARYRNQFTVIAIPVWGPKLAESKPVGWVVVNVNPEQGLPKKTASGDIEWVRKPKLTYGSEPGIVGDMDRLSQAAVAWKLEGITDVLAALSLADLPPDVVIVTNSNGAQQRPTKWMVDAIATTAAGPRPVNVLHDADVPGQRGATGWDDDRGRHREGWTEACARATETRNIELPYPVAETHGQDVRDWIAEGHGYGDLRALADAASITHATAVQVNEAPDDPYRLARLNLDRYAKRTGGRTIKFWNGSWWTWKNCRYVATHDEEIRAKITGPIKEEMDQLNLADLESFEERKKTGQLDNGEQPPFVKKVTPQLVSQVVGATKQLTIISGEVELNSWLPTKERKSYVSMANGLLDIEAVMANASSDYLIPHTPDWFSCSHHPYPFDPTARCPIWRDFLDYNLEGDHEMIDFLQEWTGYLLLPDTGEQRFLILEGEGGNGKSVFGAGVEAIIGEKNCSHVPLEQFGDRFSKTATLGKLVNSCGDVGELDAVAEGAIKAFTSGNRMSFDRKGLAPLDALPTARLMIACNALPRMKDRSEGIWRRVLVSPWRRKVPKEKRIKNMDKAEWWAATGELPGMFNWAIQGLARLRTQDEFTEVSSMNAALATYRLESNPAKLFLAEFTTEAPKVFLKCEHLFREYQRWAASEGYRPLSHTQFGKEVVRAYRGCQPVRRGKRGHQKKFYSGVDYQDGAISGEDLCNAYPETF